MRIGREIFIPKRTMHDAALESHQALAGGSCAPDPKCRDPVAIIARFGIHSSDYNRERIHEIAQKNRGMNHNDRSIAIIICASFLFSGKVFWSCRRYTKEPHSIVIRKGINKR